MIRPVLFEAIKKPPKSPVTLHTKPTLEVVHSSFSPLHSPVKSLVNGNPRVKLIATPEPPAPEPSRTRSASGIQAWGSVKDSQPPPAMDASTLHNELLRMQRNLSHSQAEYIHAARRMMYLVKAVDLTLESLYAGPALSRAIWRYEALWFPLLAALSSPPSSSPPAFKWATAALATKVDEIRAKNFTKRGLWLSVDDLVPPLDIAWVWYVHRLNPDAYAEDLAQFAQDGDEDTVNFTREACATRLDTAFKFSDGEDAQSKRTRRLWAIVYPFEAFMPKYLLSHSYEEEEARKRHQITSYTNEITRSAFRSVLKHDLERAVALQKAFLYQIVNEDEPEKAELFETPDYLNRAYQRYLQFIALHERAPGTFLVPMNDINIMWHMHLGATREYAHDCNVLIGRLVVHDSIAVDEIRKTAIAAMETEIATNTDIPTVQSEMEDEELADLLEKRRRGVAIKETKTLWETFYGSKPRYDLLDTRYRGGPPGERGGFHEMFEKINGTTKDISWPETMLRMLLAIFVFGFGSVLLVWSFWKTMATHGRYMVGLPAGLGVMGLGLYIFLAIPINRPLSSDSRYWLERSYKQTHNPLPPYLISTSKKAQ